VALEAQLPPGERTQAGAMAHAELAQPQPSAEGVRRQDHVGHELHHEASEPAALGHQRTPADRPLAMAQQPLQALQQGEGHGPFAPQHRAGQQAAPPARGPGR